RTERPGIADPSLRAEELPAAVPRRERSDHGLRRGRLQHPAGQPAAGDLPAPPAGAHEREHALPGLGDDSARLPDRRRDRRGGGSARGALRRRDRRLLVDPADRVLADPHAARVPRRRGGSAPAARARRRRGARRPDSWGALARYLQPMPELPEMEAWRRQLSDPVSAFRIAHAGPAHIATLKTFDPPLTALEGRRF